MGSPAKRNAYILFGSAIIGIILFIALYRFAFPESALNIQVDSSEAKSLSDNFLKAQGHSPENYTHAAVFSSYDTQRLFLEDTVGLEETNRLSQKRIPLWYWSVVYYTELETEGFEVILSPDGIIIDYRHFVNETASGKSLAQKEAQAIAEQFIQSQGITLTDYQQTDTSSTKRQNRVDHFFEWEEKSFSVPYGSSNATLRVGVEVAGDEVITFYRDWLEVPEEYITDTAKIDAQRVVFGLVSLLFTALTYIAIIVIFAKNYSTISKKFALWSALIIVAATVLATMNSYPLLAYNYNTDMSYIVYWSTIALFSMIGMVVAGIAIFLVAGAGESLAKEVYPKTVNGLLQIKERVLSVQFTRDAIIGYSLAAIFLGYLAVFYAVGKQYFGFWSPADVNNVITLNVLIPFLVPLSISLVAAISEEYIYRMFAISFIQKYTKKMWIALLIPAIIWAFGHATYVVFPIYARFIELTIAGLLFGWFFIRYGLFAVVIAHYVIDATLISIPLLSSNDVYLFVSGLLVVGLMFVPAGVGYVALKRKQ